MRALLTFAIPFGLDLAVKATFLFCVTAAALLLLRRASAATRHLVGAFGLAAALLLPALTLTLPRIRVPLLPDVRPAVGRHAALSPAMLEEISSAPVAAPPNPAPAIAPLPTELVPAVAPPRPGAVGSASFGWLAVALWGIGTLLIGARLATGWARVRRISREASPIRDLDWLAERQRLARRLELDRRVEMLESPEVPVAMTTGLLRPILLIGKAARSWAEERRRVVLLHELAHVKRADWPALVAAELAIALYWFHPLAWWLGRRVRRDAEQASDDLVIASGTKPSVYAGHLLGIFRSLASPAHPVAPALAAIRPHHFEERLRAILDPRAPRRTSPPGRARLASIGLIAAAFAVAAVSPWKPRTIETCARPGSSRASFEGAAPAAAVAEPGARGRDDVTDSKSAAPPRCQPRSEETTGAKVRAVPAVLKEVSEIARGFVQASRRAPRDGGDWYDEAMQLHREERYPEAIEAFQKAIEAGHREAAATYNIACGYARMGENDRAFEWLRRAIESGFDVASYLSRDDDLENLKSDPRWGELKKLAREQKGDRHEAEGRAAASRLERLLAKPPSTGEPFFGVGRDLLKADRYDLAAKAYQAAAERGYRAGTALYNEACALSLGGDASGALDRLARALDAGFDQPDLFRTDDDLDAVRGDPRFAELAREARDLSLPGFGASWGRRSSANRARWREAAHRFEAYAAHHPEKGRAWFNLGFASLAGDRPEAAADAFRKALELGYRKPTTMYNLACAYARVDQKDAAFDWLFRALDAGFDQAGTLRGDDDLDNLRGDSRYRQALSIVRDREREKDKED